ncbi:MAG: thiamine pyrophosphate-dependent dehydrogenase E1 component subunit alpha [Gemmatimonadaceae bacterium]|nr:thiamine pyrophosphate-dependent dehydrogenase E1 component subunit alpha [Gemmatimonadaceae bacterium]MDQ3244601.1 thiamine pyrophosphate-dependent dehydrogenase E1 component subunit alpha [Gemmatimonadota bacterium]
MSASVIGRSSGEAASLGHLADADRYHEPISIDPQDTEAFLSGLHRMILIRVVEEKIGDMVSQGVVKCPCHLAIGQEAPAVGVASYVRPGDRVFGAHRSHGHFLALGGSPHGLLAEVQGKDTGVSRGMGGSMHLIDIPNGLFGTVPIVGATIPIAVGAGIAAKMDGRGDMAVSFFGDGATEEGAFHESMNLAAVMNTPVLFVCENNFFSSHLHINLRQPDTSVCRYAEAHRIEWARADGNDLAAVRSVTKEAVESIRAGNGPRFLELVTYRWRGHVGHREDEDVGVKRKDDLTAWKLRDPISRLAVALDSIGAIDRQQLKGFWTEAHSVVEEAWATATHDGYPPAKALLSRVYSGGMARRQ